MTPTDPEFAILDDLAIRARAGDGEAGNAAMRVAAPLLDAIARQLVRHFNLWKRADDVRADVDHEAAKALARYDPGQGRAAVYIVKTARLGALRKARDYFSPVGARAAGKDRALNFNDPVFKGYVPFGEASSGDDDGGIEERLPGDLGTERTERERRRAAAQRIGKLLQRLPPLEQEVTRRRFGIPPRARELAPSRRGARLATNRAETYDEIAESLGTTRQTITNILKRVLPTLGLENLPAPVGRNRLPIAP